MALCWVSTLFDSGLILSVNPLFLMTARNEAHIAIECRYNAVQYSKILHKWLRESRQNINQMLDPQTTPHTPPWRARHGVSFVNICEKKWPRYNGTALYHDYDNYTRIQGPVTGTWTNGNMCWIRDALSLSHYTSLVECIIFSCQNPTSRWCLVESALWHITMILLSPPRASWRLRLPATRLFVQMHVNTF